MPRVDLTEERTEQILDAFEVCILRYGLWGTVDLLGNEKLRVILPPDEARRRSGVSSTPEVERSQVTKGPQPEGSTSVNIRRSR